MIVWICILVFLGSTLARESKLVNLAQGPVLGYKSDDADVFEFRGIPYATVPTGRDKFKGPLPGPNWTEPLEATDVQTICPQFPLYFQGKIVKEDCLIAHVFTPNTAEKNLPVLVNVHGSGFVIGFGDLDVPKQFVESKKIVAVTFNYRLGPHGFLCMGTEDIPGNAGIKDQVAALRWVKANIAEFGGNPDDVTVSGCSAGGGSVALLTLSKITKGLFNKIIVQSGSSVGTIAVQMDPIENAKYYASRANYTGADDLESLEEYFKSTPLEQLLTFTLLENRDHTIKMAPCIERDVGTEMFLEDAPINIIKSGDYERYPMICGFADMEGLFRIFQFETWKDEMNQNFAPFLPDDLQFESVEEKEKLAREVKQFYFGDKLVSNETFLEFTHFISDVLFIFGMQRGVSLEVESGHNNIYYHVYTFYDENTDIPYTDERGANHCAQNTALFDENYSNLTPEYKVMKDKIREMSYDFMTTGNPTPQGSSLPRWEPVIGNRSPIMNFGRTIQLTGPFEKERADFWQKIYDKYYRVPVPPSSASLPATLNLLLGVTLFFFIQLISV